MSANTTSHPNHTSTQVGTEVRVFKTTCGDKIPATRHQEVGGVGKSGKKTHTLEVWRSIETGRVMQAYSHCGSARWSRSGRSILRVGNGEDLPVTCTKCNPDAPKTAAPEAAPEPKEEAPAATKLTDAQQRRQYALERAEELRERIEMNRAECSHTSWFQQTEQQLAKLEAKLARQRVRLPGE